MFTFDAMPEKLQVEYSDSGFYEYLATYDLNDQQGDIVLNVSDYEEMTETSCNLVQDISTFNMISETQNNMSEISPDVVLTGDVLYDYKNPNG